MPTTNLYLVRHGQTYLNTLNRCQGWIDSELTPAGQDQARHTGQALANTHFDLAVSSDLHRAIQTRDLIIGQLKQVPLKVSTDPNFREVFFSTFEGLPASAVFGQLLQTYGFKDQDEIITKHNFATVRRLMREMDPRHEAELYDQVTARWRAGLAHLASQLPNGGNVLIIGHGALIRTIGDFYGHDVRGVHPANGSLTRMTMTSPATVELLSYSQEL